MLIAALRLSRISSDFVPIEVILFGGVMLVIIVLIHGAGLDRIVVRYKLKADDLRSRGWHPHMGTAIFAAAIVYMLALHITEACIWGVVLYKVHLITSLRDSIYFSANTYTTIGYGKFILPDNWRELSPIMAISGLFTFAWTTGEMFNLVGMRRELAADLQQQRHGRRQSPQHNRSRATAPTVEESTTGSEP